MDCIFCKIANKIIPTEIIYEDNQLLAFNDIHPKAPHHLLIIPKKHIATLNDLTSEDEALVGRMVLVAQKLAKDLKVADSGYRILANCNQDAGQVIYHLHLHLLGGRKLYWPPG